MSPWKMLITIGRVFIMTIWINKIWCNIVENVKSGFTRAKIVWQILYMQEK